jgi:rubredoxin
MALKTMDPAIARRLIEAEVDVITPAAKLDAELFKYCQCPVCGNQGADKVTMPPRIVQNDDGTMGVLRSPFSTSSPTIQGHARCPVCRTEYSPRTGVIIKSSTPTIDPSTLTDVEP